MDLPPPKALLFIATVMVPTVLVAAWLLNLALGPRYQMPPPPRKKPRKRPIDMGPETRMFDLSDDSRR